MKLNLDDITIGKRFRKTAGDIDTLVDSINNVGLVQPVVIDGDHRLIAGWRRIKAWKKAKPGKDIPVFVVTTLGSALSHLYAERDENTCREDLPASEKIALGMQIENLEKRRFQQATRW